MFFKNIRSATVFIVKEEKCLRKCVNVAIHKGLSLLLCCVAENGLNLYQAWVYLKLKEFSPHIQVCNSYWRSFDCIVWQILFVYLPFLSLTNYIFVKTDSFSTFILPAITQTSALQWEVLFQGTGYLFKHF